MRSYAFFNLQQIWQENKSALMLSSDSYNPSIHYYNLLNYFMAPYDEGIFTEIVTVIFPVRCGGLTFLYDSVELQCVISEVSEKN